MRNLDAVAFWDLCKRMYEVQKTLISGLDLGEYVEILVMHRSADIQMHVTEATIDDTPVGFSLFFEEDVHGKRIQYRWGTVILPEHQSSGLYAPLIKEGLEARREHLDAITWKTQNPRVFKTLANIAGGAVYPDWRDETPIPGWVYEVAQFCAGKYPLDEFLAIHNHPIYRDALSRDRLTSHSLRNQDEDDRKLVTFMEGVFKARINAPHTGCFQAIAEVR